MTGSLGTEVSAPIDLSVTIKQKAGLAWWWEEKNQASLASVSPLGEQGGQGGKSSPSPGLGPATWAQSVSRPAEAKAAALAAPSGSRRPTWRSLRIKLMDGLSVSGRGVLAPCQSPHQTGLGSARFERWLGWKN